MAVAGIQQVSRGNYFEDFAPGREFVHRWGRTLTLAESIQFATTTLSFNEIYFNSERAVELGYREIPIHPYLVFCVVLGLTVEDLSEVGGPFLGMSDLSFGVPAYPGDTVAASSIVVERRESASRPGWGIVSWRTVGRNSRNEELVSYTRTNLSRMRSGDDA